MSVKPKLPAKSTAGTPVNGIEGMHSMHNDIGEKSGFESGVEYLDKKGTPYGMNAMFNKMPPGMDITNQEVADFRNMPLKKLVHESYEGDGWEPGPRDIPE